MANNFNLNEDLLNEVLRVKAMRNDKVNYNTNGSVPNGVKSVTMLPKPNLENWINYIRGESRLNLQVNK